MSPDDAHPPTLSTKDPGFGFLRDERVLKTLPAEYSAESAARQAAIATRPEAQTQAKVQGQKKSALPPRSPAAPREDTARAHNGNTARKPAASSNRKKDQSPTGASTDYGYKQGRPHGKLYHPESKSNFPEQSVDRGDAGPPADGMIKSIAKTCVAALKWLKSTAMPRRGQYYG